MPSTTLTPEAGVLRTLHHFRDVFPRQQWFHAEDLWTVHSQFWDDRGAGPPTRAAFARLLMVLERDGKVRLDGASVAIIENEDAPNG